MPLIRYEMVGIDKDQPGRGPTRVGTGYRRPDTVVRIQEQTFTPTEPTSTSATA